MNVSISGDTLADFTREMPWSNNVSASPSAVNVGGSVDVTLTVKNEMQCLMETLVEGQIGNGNYIPSQKVIIAPGSQTNFTITIPDVSLASQNLFRYRVLSTDELYTDTLQVTDHGRLPGLVTVQIQQGETCDLMLFHWQSPEGDFWSLGVNTKGCSDITRPSECFSKAFFYKNGSKITPSEKAKAKFMEVISREYDLTYPNLGLGTVYDTELSIWCKDCGWYEWPCYTALVSFSESERKAIYKDLIWEALTNRQTPFLLQDIFVSAGENSAHVSTPPPSIVFKINDIEKQIDTVLGSPSNFLNYFKKLLKIAEGIKNSISGVSELTNQIKGLSAVIDIIHLANLNTKASLETVQYAILMDYLATTGLAEERLKTMQEAYTFASQNESRPVDQAIGLALAEIEVELPAQIINLKQKILDDYFLVSVELLWNSEYVRSRLLELASETKLYKSLLQSVTHKLRINGDPIISSLILGKDLYTSALEPGNEWRRIHLAANLSRLVSKYATYSPSYRAGWDTVHTDSTLARHEVHDVYDLMTSFQYEYLNRGIILLDSEWSSVFSSYLNG